MRIRFAISLLLLSSMLYFLHALVPHEHKVKHCGSHDENTSWTHNLADLIKRLLATDLGEEHLESFVETADNNLVLAPFSQDWQDFDFLACEPAIPIAFSSTFPQFLEELTVVFYLNPFVPQTYTSHLQGRAPPRV